MSVTATWYRFHGTGPSNINPTATRDEQLSNIRAIYPPDKEALGALATEIQLLG